jgi:hypothetical protein
MVDTPLLPTSAPNFEETGAINSVFGPFPLGPFSMEPFAGSRVRVELSEMQSAKIGRRFVVARPPALASVTLVSDR